MFSYASRCKGWDEICPLSGGGNNFWGGLGMMVVESLDTLYIMDLQDEYKEAREWVASSLNLDINHFTSVFETTIRLLGGLLSAYSLTHDPIYKTRSLDLATRLLRSHTNALHFVLLSFFSLRSRQTSISTQAKHAAPIPPFFSPKSAATSSNLAFSPPSPATTPSFAPQSEF